MSRMQRLERLLDRCVAYERDTRVARGAYYLEGRITAPAAHPSPLNLAVEIARDLPALVAVANAAQAVDDFRSGRSQEADGAKAHRDLESALAALKEVA